MFGEISIKFIFKLSNAKVLGRFCCQNDMFVVRFPVIKVFMVIIGGTVSTNLTFNKIIVISDPGKKNLHDCQ